MSYHTKLRIPANASIKLRIKVSNTSIYDWPKKDSLHTAYLRICIALHIRLLLNTHLKHFKHESRRKRNVEYRCVNSASHEAIGKSLDLSSFFGGTLSASRHMAQTAQASRPFETYLGKRYISFMAFPYRSREWT